MIRLRRGSTPLRLSTVVATVIGLTIALLAWQQSERERQFDLQEIARRARALAFQAAFPVREALKAPDPVAEVLRRQRLEGHGRLLGYAVYRVDGTPLAQGTALTDAGGTVKAIAGRALHYRQEVLAIDRDREPPLHLLAVPLRDQDGAPLGALVVVHDIEFIDKRARARLGQFALWILVVLALVFGVVSGGAWLAYERPLRRLADWMRRLRLENVQDAPPRGLPIALLESESSRLAASYRAARAFGRTRSRHRVRQDRVWSRERLRSHAIDCLGEQQQLIVLSNREPYMHQLEDGEARMIIPAGGVVTALDPVLRACGGLWVAHGAGDADRDHADAHGRLTVPPGDARYTLRRIWMTREEEQGYYEGFSNEGLWPMCHLTHERPIFRAADWEHYVRINQRFADAVVEESGDTGAVVLVQDYQLALVPAMLKAVRPDLCVGLFWHIPWSNPEAFRICPYRMEILQGMLGADLVGFHLQQYCNNFLDTVDRMLEARLDWDHFAVDLRGHTSQVRPFPISVQSWKERKVPQGQELADHIAKLRHAHGLEGVRLAVGVDRIDYTKGMAERMRAVARFLEKHPQHRGTFSFVQLGAPSRTHIPRYREYINEIETLADDINREYQTGTWQPIHFLVAHHDATAVHSFMRMAEICVVSSLHDGMNLVAKEFVAAREDNDGVLILSEFAGAARELPEALIINPYDVEQFADALATAMDMEPAERRARMERMRRSVDENNIYRWAAAFLTELAATRGPPGTIPVVESASL
ncbi:MAG: trehalose-6-phosphate synthase [Gammaproteobacteria bacterium]|nr:trehalose-6-phosphate synthase [Gammaproteobacteria bacterium]